MNKTIAAIAILSTLYTPANAKTKPTYFTPKRVATAQNNVDRYDWAKRLNKKILTSGDPVRYYVGQGTYTSADDFAALSDDEMWLLMPVTTIPRVYPHERRALCPVHGAEVKKYSVWCPWTIDPINHPYRVRCMIGGEWYPSNKFHEGDMTSGDFPDDGSGCTYKGEKYHFLSEYIHMVYGSVVTPTLKSLSEAYQLTGDVKYARKGCILIARLAQQYPNYGWEGTSFEGKGFENRFDRTYLGPYDNQHPRHAWKKGGFVTDLIWETFNLETQAYAYDGLYDYMDDDESMIAFLRDKGMPVENGDELRQYIETYLFRAAMKGLEEGWIHGNEGFHQAAALAVALVMDDFGDTHPNSADMIEYAYHGQGHAAYMMINGVDRNGGGHESPNYNRIKLDFIRVSRLMEEIRKHHPNRFSTERYPDLFAAPQARRIFDYYIDIYVNDSLFPSIGDCGGIGTMLRRSPSYSFLKKEYLFAVEHYGDPRYARACVDENGEPLAGELWESYPEEAIEAALKDNTMKFERTSRLLDGYGVGILESGESDKKRSFFLNYTALRGHWQGDPLTLGLYARGVNLLPDLGYPKTWDYRWQYDSNSLAHNTVTIDETQPSRDIGNVCRLFAVEDGVHVITASHQPYIHGIRDGAPKNDLYERTSIMVDVDSERSYVVDCFAVNGGEQHDQSWHAFRSEPDMPKLDWSAHPGTLAGESVERFDTWTDKWGRKRNDFPSYLTNIHRAKLDTPATWTWHTGLPEADALSLHIVPVDGPVEVIRGDGRSPVREELPYLFIRRTIDSGALSVFLSVLDPWQGEPTVAGVRLIGSSPIEIEVTRPDGTDRITFVLPDAPSATLAQRPIGIRVVSCNGGQISRVVSIGKVGDKSGYITTKILAADYSAQIISLPDTPGFVSAFKPGRLIRIFNGERSAQFKIVSARKGSNRLVLSLDGTALFARGMVRSVAGGRVDLDAHFTFATGDIENGRLTSGPFAFAGTWLDRDDRAQQIAGATQNGSIMLKKPAPEAKLKKSFGGQIVSVWLYGPGDSVEVALVESVVKKAK